MLYQYAPRNIFYRLTHLILSIILDNIRCCLSYIIDIEVFMNHDLLKSVIYDQHEIIKNFQIIPSDSCLEMVD